MSSNLRDNSAARVSMKDLERHARQGIHDRQQAEQSRFNGPRRWRRKNGRTEFVAIRTYPEIKEMIAEMADEQRKYLGEIVEDAVRLLASKPRHKQVRQSNCAENVCFPAVHSRA